MAFQGNWGGNWSGNWLGALGYASVDVRVSWVQFDTAASAVDVRVSWLQFDTAATPVDVRVSWIALDTAAIFSMQSDWIVLARRRGRR